MALTRTTCLLALWLPEEKCLIKTAYFHTFHFFKKKKTKKKVRAPWRVSITPRGSGIGRSKHNCFSCSFPFVWSAHRNQQRLAAEVWGVWACRLPRFLYCFQWAGSTPLLGSIGRGSSGKDFNNVGSQKKTSLPKCFQSTAGCSEVHSTRTVPIRWHVRDWKNKGEHMHCPFFCSCNSQTILAARGSVWSSWTSLQLEQLSCDI